MEIKEEAGTFHRFDKKIFLIIFILVLLLIIVFGIFVFRTEKDNKLICGDETSYNECSYRKPYYCLNGTLVERASVCGCPEILTRQENSCVSKYQNNSKEISLKYVLRGKEKEINYVVYNGLADYLLNLPRFINYESGKEPSRRDFKLKNIDEKEQRELLLPLVIEIQNIADNQDDQMRIAVSLVQNIDFGQSEKNITLFSGQQVSYSRYAYEVLYDNQGVCGEKSELLAFILRELGYGVAFFYYPNENHESVGIKCPLKYSLNNTGYCFIETTGPSIITDNSIVYVGGIKLNSKPEIILISEGNSLGEDLYEYEDAKDLIKITNGEFVLFSNYKFKKLKEKYKLKDFYNV